MFKLLRRLVVAILVLAGIVALAGAAAFVSGGISARQSPGAIELAVAPKLRSLAIRREAREQKSPVSDSPAVIKEGMEHFADHCAICHGNDGSGNTEMGRGLYPKVPDMRLDATQSLTDGELFYIIERGVPLTGMPAWGTGHAEGAESSWHLVDFIRHLPKITPAEIAAMEKLNPKGPDEGGVDPDAFLKGEDAPAAKKPAHKHGGGEGK